MPNVAQESRMKSTELDTTQASIYNKEAHYLALALTCWEYRSLRSILHHLLSLFIFPKPANTVPTGSPPLDFKSIKALS